MKPTDPLHRIAELEEVNRRQAAEIERLRQLVLTYQTQRTVTHSDKWSPDIESD